MTIRDLMHWDRPLSLPVLRRGRMGQPLTTLQDEMNRLFEDFMENSNFPSLRTWNSDDAAIPAVDIIENEKDYKIRAELPGINPDDIEVSVTDSFLTIKGKKEEEKEEQGENYLRRESSFGTFQRTLPLSEAADTQKAEATYRNGILTVEVPKKTEALQKPKKLTVRKAA